MIQKQKIEDLLFDDPKREPIPYFSQEEVKGFIQKYSEYWDSSLRNKSIDENFQVIFNDTKGHPIMVRFSVLKNGLKNHVRQMYPDWLLTKDNSLNIERIKSVIACSLYHISSIPLNDKILSVDLGLEDPSYELDKTIIKLEGNIWTTIHPRWDLELFNYLFSLNSYIRKIQRVFSFILNKILEIQFKSYNQLLILNTVYNSIAVEKFIDIKIIKEMIKVDDIEKKLDDPFFKLLFFTRIAGVAFHNLKDHKKAIECYDNAIEINPQYGDAYFYKGLILSDLGRKEEAIACFDKALEINPQHANAYYNKGFILSDLDKKEEAIVWYDESLAIDPNDSDAINGKAFALANLGKNEEALSIIEKVLESDSNNEYYLSTAAFIMYNLKRYDEAKNYYNKALIINPNLKDTLSESELKAFNSVMK